MMLASGLLLRDFFAQSGSYTQQVKNFVPICVISRFSNRSVDAKDPLGAAADSFRGSKT